MSANIIYPNIKGNDEQQLHQIRSYLYQLAEQLNYALSQTGDGAGLNIAPSLSGGGRSGSGTEETPEETFESIKALIIKSSDIVNAYYDEISARLTGDYVAQSEYGTFKEQTENELSATSSLLSSTMTELQKIDGDVTYLKNTNAYFKVGLLDTDIYGVEIGRTTTQNGVVTFSRYARFLPNRLSFYDGEGNELAYFSDYRLHVYGVTAQEINVGGYRLDTSDGLMFLWEG